jgi:hypothetical protein
MAALMKADAVGKPTGDCLHVQHVEQELATVVRCPPPPPRLTRSRSVVVRTMETQLPGTDHVGKGWRDLEERSASAAASAEPALWAARRFERLGEVHPQPLEQVPWPVPPGWALVGVGDGLANVDH